MLSRGSDTRVHANAQRFAQAHLVGRACPAAKEVELPSIGAGRQCEGMCLFCRSQASPASEGLSCCCCGPRCYGPRCCRLPSCSARRTQIVESRALPSGCTAWRVKQPVAQPSVYFGVQVCCRSSRVVDVQVASAAAAEDVEQGTDSGRQVMVEAGGNVEPARERWVGGLEGGQAGQTGCGLAWHIMTVNALVQKRSQNVSMQLPCQAVLASRGHQLHSPPGHQDSVACRQGNGLVPLALPHRVVGAPTGLGGAHSHVCRQGGSFSWHASVIGQRGVQCCASKVRRLGCRDCCPAKLALLSSAVASSAGWSQLVALPGPQPRLTQH